MTPTHATTTTTTMRIAATVARTAPSTASRSRVVAAVRRPFEAPRLACRGRTRVVSRAVHVAAIAGAGRARGGVAFAPRREARRSAAPVAMQDAENDVPRAEEEACEEDECAVRVVEEEFPRDEVERLQRATLMGMFVSYCSAYFVRKPMSVVKKPMQDALGFSTGTVGLIDSAFLLTYALGQFVIPAIGDKVGAKKVIIVGGVVSFLCCVAFGYIALPYALMALWAINGLAQSASYPLHVKLLNPWFTSKERGTAMGIWATSQQVGATGATVLAAWLLAKVGWRLSIAIPAAFMLVTSLLLANMNLDPPWLQNTTYGEEALKNTKKGSPDVEPASAGIAFTEVLRIPRLKMLMVSYFFVKIVRYCLLFWLPYYLAKEFGMSVAIAGYLSCVYDLGGVLGGLSCGVIGDKFFQGRRPMLGAIFCAILTFAIGGYQTACGMGIWANGLCMALIGFLVAGPDALLGSTAIADCCEQAGYGEEVLGTAAGIVNGMGSIGAVLQGTLTAYIAEKYGWGALFCTLAVLSALSVVSLLAATNSKFVESDQDEDEGIGATLVVA